MEESPENTPEQNAEIKREVYNELVEIREKLYTLLFNSDDSQTLNAIPEVAPVPFSTNIASVYGAMRLLDVAIENWSEKYGI